MIPMGINLVVLVPALEPLFFHGSENKVLILLLFVLFSHDAKLEKSR